jgi:hypothetical protein
MPLSHALDKMAAAAPTIEGVWARDVIAGDWIIVRTQNSTYALSALGRGRFVVSGGWFAAEKRDNSTVTVSGCTWGGHAIVTGLIAAPGMSLEFGNGVVTTCIVEVQLIRTGKTQTIH